MDNIDRQLEYLISRSEEMLKQAEQGDWLKVMADEVERSEQIRSVFSAGNNVEKNEETDKQICKIININKKLEAIASSAKEKRLNDLTSFGKGREAVKLYGKHTTEY